jgi:hypothetical protein
LHSGLGAAGEQTADHGCSESGEADPPPSANQDIIIFHYFFPNNDK